ncbi:MAG: glycoside hydrolase family 99-like domain-containing protein [Candidatus Sumerlaeaceae bacterium]
MRYSSLLILLWIGTITVSSIAVEPAAAKSTTSTRAFDVATIYFPSWHPDDHYSAWFGEGWNEWQLLMNAPQRYPGQTFLKPDSKPFNEADPAHMARQVDLAADHGIDVFIFDWYWYSGVRFIEGALTDGFLKASNRNRMKYALMWANHDWKNVFPAPTTGSQQMLLPIRHSVADFQRAIRYCAQTHFNQPNYWRVKGAVYFSFFQPDVFVKQLGGVDKARTAIDEAREYLREQGIGEMHLGAFIWQESAIESLTRAGFNSFTSYNVTGSGKAKLPEKPLDSYDDLVENHPKFWDFLTTGTLPYCPVATVGWDPSPRWHKDTPWPPAHSEYPYGTLVQGTNPEAFGRLCQLARQHLEKHPAPMVLLNAWNEWTEGSALLPTAEFGNAYLEEVKRAFKR